VAQTPAVALVSVDALQLRADMADAVGRGTEKAEAALARLKQFERPMGHKADRDADFAFASLDIGQRLSGTGKSMAAEVFFKAAEVALETSLKKNPESEPSERAQLWQQLALIRSQFLGKATQAKADLDEALRSSPEQRLSVAPPERADPVPSGALQ